MRGVLHTKEEGVTKRRYNTLVILEDAGLKAGENCSSIVHWKDNMLVRVMTVKRAVRDFEFREFGGFHIIIA